MANDLGDWLFGRNKDHEVNDKKLLNQFAIDLNKQKRKDDNFST